MIPIDSNRVHFRKYLERAGVVEALNNAFLKLYEEENKPDDVTSFVRQLICDTCPNEDEFNALKKELDETLKKLEKLEDAVDSYKVKIIRTPEEVVELLENGYNSLIEDEVNTSSLLRKYLTAEIIEEYKEVFTSPPVDASLLDCVQSGFVNHDSSCGVYAADPESYDIYKKLFDPVIRDYHGQLENENEQLQPETDFGNTNDILNIDPEKKYVLSTRIRIARNIEGYPYFCKLTENQLIELEEKVKNAVNSFEGELAGAYLSMKDIDPETQEEMVKRNIFFKRGDTYLYDAGCYHFWPSGRGIFKNPEETFLIWVNEEDHLRIISLVHSGDLGEVYNRLVKGLQQLEKTFAFSRHPRYGNLTACPTNLGTTLRASVHIRLPNLSRDSKRLNNLANDLNLQIRGTGGEHTAIKDGIMDISNRRRLGFTEFELVKSLQEGILAVIKAEKQLTR